MQMQLDLESLARATGRTFTESERQEIQAIQERSYDWTFIGSGIDHAKFVKTFQQVSPSAQAQLAKVSTQYSLS